MGGVNRLFGEVYSYSDPEMPIAILCAGSEKDSHGKTTKIRVAYNEQGSDTIKSINDNFKNEKTMVISRGHGMDPFSFYFPTIRKRDNDIYAFYQMKGKELTIVFSGGQSCSHHFENKGEDWDDLVMTVDKQNKKISVERKKCYHSKVRDCIYK